MVHREAAVQPWNPLGVEIKNRVQSRRECLAAGGLAEHRRRDLSLADGGKPVDADLLHGDILTRKTEPAQRQRGRRVAFRAHAADADDSAPEVRRGLHVRSGEHGRADDVGERSDASEIAAAGRVGAHHGGHADVHEMDAAGLELGAGFASSHHGDDFELQSLGLVKSGGLRHPDGQESIGRSRLADLERDELGGVGPKAA